MQVELLHVAIGGGVLLTILLIWILILELRLRRLTKGSDKKNMESHLAAIARDYQDLNDWKTDIHGQMANLNGRLQDSVRGVGTVRFHPFAGSGLSKPSFATAFVSENGNGIVISTLHAHNSVSIFNKTIENFRCDKELSEEEAAALEKAKNSLHT